MRYLLAGSIALTAALIAWLAMSGIGTTPEVQRPRRGAPPEGSQRAAPPTAVQGPARPVVADVEPADETLGPDVDPEHGAEPEPPEEEIWEEAEYDVPVLLAAIGLAPDAPRALLIGRVGPPDPLETGEASLHLELFDQVTGEPVASPVVLWRLDAPGNEYWLRGDQAIAHEEIPARGRTLEGLAAGRYRIVCTAERSDAPHSQAFDVAGHTQEVLFLELPGERPVRLELTANGKRVEHAELWIGPVNAWSVGPSAPAWVRQRDLRNPPDVMIISDFESSEGNPEFEQWWPARAGPDGFDLGSLPGDRRDRRYSCRVRARDEAGRSTEVVVSNGARGVVLCVSGTLTEH